MLTVLKEIAHFLRKAPEVMRLQRQYDRAGFVDALNARVDAQGYAEVRRELVGDLSGRVLEVGCGTGAMFEYYGDGWSWTRSNPSPISSSWHSPRPGGLLQGSARRPATG